MGLDHGTGIGKGRLLNHQVGDISDGPNTVALIVHIIGEGIFFMDCRDRILRKNRDSAVDAEFRHIQQILAGKDRPILSGCHIQPGRQQGSFPQAVPFIGQFDHIAPVPIGFQGILLCGGIADSGADQQRIHIGFLRQQGDLQASVGTHIGINAGNFRP